MFRPTAFFELIGPGGAQERFTIRRPRFVIGSAETADVVINHPAISSEQVVIEHSATGWTAAAVGHSPVTLNGLSLTSRAINSGDLLDIDGLVALTFRDPIEDKARAKEKAGKEGASPAEKPARSRYLIPALIFSGMMSLVLVLIGMRGEETPLPDLRINSAASVRAALDGGPLAGIANPTSLAECIGEAGSGESIAARIRVGETPFWNLAQDYSGTEARTGLIEDPRFQALRRTIEQYLFDARTDERAGRQAQAREAYAAVLRLVPDAACSIHLLASARMNALGEANR